ncbi:hypothetical protein AMECASPLE_028778 [Ameca splendens]|uniref:Uncharacterized protein n=1 Tax=Ameca splendens TaxID=208324 RepID=A0ABV0ZSE8_9TELE
MFPEAGFLLLVFKCKMFYSLVDILCMDSSGLLSCFLCLFEELSSGLSMNLLTAPPAAHLEPLTHLPDHPPTFTTLQFQSRNKAEDYHQQTHSPIPKSFPISLNHLGSQTSTT